MPWSERLRRLWKLEPGDLSRLWPFFGLYFLLFCLLAVADGLSMSLFVQRVGAALLPRCYAGTALLNLVAISAYISRAERAGSRRSFHAILAAILFSLLCTWLAIRGFGGGLATYGLLFAVREVAYTLVLMHFGTFLQDHFTRVEMNRVLAIVYAGGRTGGIAGGALLGLLPQRLGMENLLLLCAALALLAMGAVEAIARVRPEVQAAEDDAAAPELVPAPGDGAALERAALGSVGGFLRYARHFPLLWWISVATVIYTACRWLLHYQYSSFFEQHFDSDVAMARFLGQYTLIALTAALFLQVFVVGRVVAALGVAWSHMLYALLVALGLLGNALHASFGLALFSRAVENELRFGFRNPIHQLLVNAFSKPMRIRVRAWSLGFLIPISTFLAGAGLSLLAPGAGVAWLGAALGAGYLSSSTGILRSYRRPS
jgi:hypothetical protein